MEQALQRAWKAWRLKPMALATWAAARQLGNFLSDSGCYGKVTEGLHRLALAISEDAVGQNHPDTGTAVNNLALFLQENSNYAAA